MTGFRRVSKRTILYPVISLLLLAGLWTEAHVRVPASVAGPYLEQSGRDVDAFAAEIYSANGTWYGTDVKTPDAATALLYSHHILSRSYQQLGGWFGDDEHAVNLLLLQCADARDLEAYDPLNCYPSMGYTLIDRRERIWVIKDLTVRGMEYRFGLRDAALGDEMVVYNFFLVPHAAGGSQRGDESDGTTVANINEVYRRGADYRHRYYGATQLQIRSSGQASREQLDQALRELVEANLDVLKSLMNQ